jgi:hypothetical protein
LWQSFSLGFLLAQKHFTNPLVVVTSAVSVVRMAVSFLVPSLIPAFIHLHLPLAFCLSDLNKIYLSKVFYFFLDSLEGVSLQFTGETNGFQRMTKMISRSKETQHMSS